MQPAPQPKLLDRIANRFGVDPDKMFVALKNTAFRQGEGKEVTNEQMMALLVVAEQYGLNPWTKEIFAFPDKGSIVPVVGIDGWARIINEQPTLDGIEFEYAESTTNASGKEVPDWCECVIYRKDRDKAVRVREYFDEVRRNTGPWGSHPRRMLRHKALIQCARVAFGFVGIHDEDEARRIIDAEAVPPPALTSTVKRRLPEPRPTIEHAPQPPEVAQQPATAIADLLLDASQATTLDELDFVRSLAAAIDSLSDADSETLKKAIAARAAELAKEGTE
jgi:phage recombination protein Bet